MEINKLQIQKITQHMLVAAIATALIVLAIVQVSKLSGSQTRMLSSGFDARNFDVAVRSQDDLYRHVNGKWLDTTEIPADKSRFGAFYELNDKTEAQLQAIVNKLAADSSVKANTEAQKIRDLYASFMNEAQLEALGTKPLQSQLAAVDEVHSAVQLPTVFAQLARRGINVPLATFVHQDNRDSIHYALDLYQAGINLPDRDYYLKDGDDGTYKKVREAYEKHIVAMFKLAAQPQPEQSAAQIMQLETMLATAQWDKVSNRDPVKTYNKFSLDKLPASNDFDWNTYLNTIGVSGKVDFLLVSQPSYVSVVTKLTKSVPIETWRRYLKWQIIDSAAPYLSKAFVDENFAFNGKVVRGIPDNRARWKRGLSVIAAEMGESLGKLYVDQYFPPENKRRMQMLVANLMLAYKQSIAGLDWMSPETKQQAQTKLAKISTKIGYPDHWRDYSTLQIAPDDLLGNVVRAEEFESQRQLNKLGKPIDREEWIMTPQTINAYYNPEKNEIVFPAAILQAPFFNMLADDAVNYGAIGTVIGHEISHGFDDQGSQYDGDGNLHDWWTKEDHEKFSSKTKALVAQYAAYESVPGYHVNGELTLGENIADLSGLSISYKAYQLSLQADGVKKSAATMDGLSGAQRFFVGLAQAWREKAREPEAIRLVTTDPHSPPRFRVLGSVSNLAAFYAAFDVKPGDKMYLSPEQRITIW